MVTVKEFAERVFTNVEHVIVGKRQAVELLLVALLCRGHVLLEDVPGTGGNARRERHRQVFLRLKSRVKASDGQRAIFLPMA